ncbi:hypothetical protein PsorP6_013610 [Peronosclerospora sorghi]|uniref:Uncharacterized protein n=1 Tax=Peronosclerospora sorghi TaxID=230839 RepID=A0ACC0VK98_9STRA|nr:hypothetical protein PsorP6_013610 [Peronosclerospora sorghi]
MEKDELEGSYSGSMKVADIEEVVDEEDVLDATDDDENDEGEVDQMVETDEEDGKKKEEHVGAVNATIEANEQVTNGTKVVEEHVQNDMKDALREDKPVRMPRSRRPHRIQKTRGSKTTTRRFFN